MVKKLVCAFSLMCVGSTMAMDDDRARTDAKGHVILSLARGQGEIGPRHRAQSAQIDEQRRDRAEQSPFDAYERMMMEQEGWRDCLWSCGMCMCGCLVVVRDILDVGTFRMRKL